MPPGFYLVDEFHQARGQNVGIRFDMDNFVGAQFLGDINRMQETAPPAGIVGAAKASQVVLEPKDEVFVRVAGQRGVMGYALDEVGWRQIWRTIIDHYFFDGIDRNVFVVVQPALIAAFP